MRIDARLFHWAQHWTPICSAALALTGGPVASQEGVDDWYVKLFGGATFPQADEFRIARFHEGSLGADLSFDTGWLVGAAVGKRAARRVGVELEFAYRRAEGSADRHRNVRETGTADSRALLLNVRYDLASVGLEGEWQPYLGMGLGAADLNTDPDFSFRSPRCVTVGAGVPSPRGHRIRAFAALPVVRRAPLVRGDVCGMG